jgi:carbon-monoxide dehydrogenase large subunit
MQGLSYQASPWNYNPLVTGTRSAEAEDRGYIGQGLRRREDPRLLRGEGLFVGDLQLPTMVHAAILRSSRAHARIRRIDADRARGLPGVLAVITAADLVNVPKLPNLVPHPALHSQMPYPLARDGVLYVGEPVAAVVAVSPYIAEDALELIDVEYEDLPVVADPEAALATGAPVLHQGMDSNLAALMAQTVGDPARVFAQADLVLRHDFRFDRISGQPMEPRGVVAVFERAKTGGAFTIWNSTQSPHTARRVIAGMLGVPQQSVRMIAPEVGGGFGVKNRVYPEELIVPFLARLVGRPVRWIEDRREDLLTTYQAREQIHHVAIAVRSDGTILGLRDHYVVDQGAYSPFGVVVPINAGNTLPGPYKLPNYDVEMRLAYTNKTPMAPYRAAGRPPGVYAMEHAIDLVARRLNLDPVEVRLRNFVQPDEFPYNLGLKDRDGTDITYDSGNYPECLTKAMDLIDVEGFRREQAAARSQGRHLGLGIGCYVESTGRGPFEGATVRVEPSGQVLVLTGAAPQGQGHETTLAQICAQRLGVDIDDITVITGDTDAIPLGIGTFASRTAVVAGNAVSLAALEVQAKAREVAAQLLEVSPQDLEVSRGVIAVRGLPDRHLSLAQVAQIVTAPPPAFTFPAGLEPGLESTRYWAPTAATFASGVHVCTVEVDPETGQVHVLRYVVVHDCGTVINPVIVDGQVHGGVAQGLGNALYERFVYDADGLPRTTTFMDYLLPTAVETPPMFVGHVVPRSPLNPAGIKGTGEGGAMPVPAAIANAVEDALAPLDVVVDSISLSPASLRELIKRAGG